MHITSLPGKYGIGKLGKQAAKFARFLARTGFSSWQVLPFGPPAAGFSPYQSYSAFAGNPMLIDPELLAADGLLLASELEEFEYTGSIHSCDFDWLAQTSNKMLRLAYSRCGQTLLQKSKVYAQEQAHWLPDYALFMTLREINEDLPWWQWQDQAQRCHDRKALDFISEQYQAELNYYYFVQFVFEQQWQLTKTLIHKAGIALIGDMPIYVSMDSSDVWSNTHLYELDEDLNPLRVAGVPPDYFTEDGQLWGNPLYFWAEHKQEQYLWWRQRIARSLHWFNYLRLDHFRGFSAYWAVAAGADNARVGEWVEGPKDDLFQYLFSDFGKEAFIAEDLGEIDDDVRDLLARLDLPGMRVLQFGFDPDHDSSHLPCFYPENSIAFTGTHDNNTLLGWLWDLDERERQFALDYVRLEDQPLDWGQGGPASPTIRALIRTVWASSAKLAIVPIQDLLGYGSDSRMNIPGQAKGQWGYRITQDDLASLDEKWLLKLNKTYKRYRINLSKAQA